MPIAPSVEKLHTIKGMLVNFIFGVGTLDWSSALLNVYYVSKSMITSIFI